MTRSGLVVIDSDGLNPYGRCVAEALAAATGGVSYLHRRAPGNETAGTAYGPARGGGGSRAGRALRLGAGLAKVVAKARTASGVLIMWETGGDALVALALRLLGRGRIVVTVHDPGREGANHRFARWAFLRAGDRIVMHSEHLAVDFARSAGIPRTRIVVVPHPALTPVTRRDDPASARDALGVPAAARVVLFFGQIRGYKGIDTLAAAMEPVLSGRPDAHLLVAGTLTEPVLARQLARLQSRHPGSVTLVTDPGPLPAATIETALSAADLVVLPFSRASQSGSAVHALSHGLPVLTTLVGDLVRLAGRGAVAAVPPNDPRALAEACGRLLDDAAARFALAQAGARFVESELDPVSIGRALATTLVAA